MSTLSTELRAPPLEDGPLTGQHARSIAMSAADLSVSVVDDVTRVMAENGNTRHRSVRVGIGRLASDGCITEKEAKELAGVAQLIFEKGREPADAPDAASELRQTHQRLALASSASPAAVAIASASKAAYSAPLPTAGQTGGATARVVITPMNPGAGTATGWCKENGE